MADRVKGSRGRTLIVAPPRSGKALHRFANPGQFLRLSGAILPWLFWTGGDLTAFSLAWGLFFAPDDWQQGDTSASCTSMFRSPGWPRRAISRWPRGQRPVAGLAPSAGRPCGGGNRACRRRFYRGVPCYGQPVGQADLGRLVGMGRPTYLGVRAVLAVSRPYRAGPRLR